MPFPPPNRQRRKHWRLFHITASAQGILTKDCSAGGASRIASSRGGIWAPKWALHASLWLHVTNSISAGSAQCMDMSITCRYWSISGNGPHICTTCGPTLLHKLSNHPWLLPQAHHKRQQHSNSQQLTLMNIYLFSPKYTNDTTLCLSFVMWRNHCSVLVKCNTYQIFTSCLHPGYLWRACRLNTIHFIKYQSFTQSFNLSPTTQYEMSMTTVKMFT